MNEKMNNFKINNLNYECNNFLTSYFSILFW